ncbi:osteopetrosis-associated transmembrane protein 1 [Anabas testudineus]|uniref:osteopetrosis-associated transmembrane protein 1 n=1 Tax=Anabas testudineus TaxID=64144 RepID=UPI000E461B53|nr:osteopetrosis-associated transmembrane protein 1 [Anabas testudineus]
MLLSSFSAMSFYKNLSFLLLLAINVYSLVSSEGITITASADISSLNPPAPAVHPGLNSLFSFSQLSFPEDLEISDYCNELLHIFGQRYVAYVSCLVPAARPVKACLNCFPSFVNLENIYNNISEKTGPGNESCKDTLLRSDRVMLLNTMYYNLQKLWADSNCQNCLTEKYQSIKNDTLYFMSMLNLTLTCFKKYQQGNHTELCINCKSTYKGLNELYSRMEKNNSLCIDIEDAMNMTRILWSKNFNCSHPREETVPVIAVSSFMLFLPIIFYLSSFLHSEQKKRKLIHPKRAKSYTSLMNIQDKQN